MRLRAGEIGGGEVQRTFRMGERQLHRGDRLTGDEVRSMRVANRMSLIDKGFLAVWPVATPVAIEGAEFHLIDRRFGLYDVIEGTKLNNEKLTKEGAEALIARRKRRRN